MSTSAHPYRLSIDGFAPSAFRVLSLTGKEAISEAWWFDVVVTADAGDPALRAALAQRATLIFDLEGRQRAFYGVVAAVRLADVHTADGVVRYVVRVVPRLWLLKRKKRTRIFQKMRVPDIVSSVLSEAGIATRWQLARAYPEREYCTQYEETDYRFVQRILAEAGIWFYFFGGGPVSGAALAADAAVGAGAAAGSAVASFVGAPDLGALAGSAAQMAETLIPGDTVVGADDAVCYPPVAGDDPAALAASTAAAMAPALGDALGAGDGIAGAVIGTASAVAGTVLAGLTEGGHAAPVLHYMYDRISAIETYDKVTRFSLRNTVRSSGAMFRAYDPDRSQVQLTSAAVSTQPFPPSPFEIAAEAAATAESAISTAASVVPGAAAGVLGAVGDAVATADAAVNEVAGALGQKVPFEVYEHHDPFLFPKWSVGNDEAPRILRQKRRRASIAEGEGCCWDFSPAHRFTLDRHLAPELDGTYVLTSVEHKGQTFPVEGQEWQVYVNTFECAPAEMPYPPPRPKRKSVQVALTATVVGPAGEEIHVDEKGQIKVQFHWDREGKYDEKSSCWIRTMQPWAGAAWGHQFIPRVGMEVVVVFEGGDPDKPMVMGSVYNATHPPTFKLPEHKTRSGIRTQSTPRAIGSNEISFEDKAGGEQLYVHAQRNYDELIEHNQTSHVRGGRTVEVDGSTSERVGHAATLHVGDDVRTTIGADEHRTVKGHSHSKIGGDRMSEVHGNTTVTVMGKHAAEVRGNRALVVGTAHEPAVSDHYVHGSASLGAAERIVIRADQNITIACGTSTIEMTPDKIVLRASTVELSPTKTLECSTKGGPSMTMGEDVEILSKKFHLFTESGALEVDKEFKVKGDSIKLGYDPSKPSKDASDAKPETSPFSCKLSNYFLAPYANKKYHLMVEGLRFEGTTDGQGVVKQDIPKSAKQAVIRLWLDDYPEGRQHVYTVKLGTLPPIDGPLGAKTRLKNLGYFTGMMTDEVDDDMRDAIMAFQQDHRDTHGLDPTGELDGGTAGALEEVHGS